MTSMPDPRHSGTPADFVAALAELRVWAGSPSLRRLRQVGGQVRSVSGDLVDALPPSTTSHILSGRGLPRMPRMEFVQSYVTACLSVAGTSSPDAEAALELWRGAWRGLAEPARADEAGPADIPQPRYAGQAVPLLAGVGEPPLDALLAEPPQSAAWPVQVVTASPTQEPAVEGPASPATEPPAPAVAARPPAGAGRRLLPVLAVVAALVGLGGYGLRASQRPAPVPPPAPSPSGLLTEASRPPGVDLRCRVNSHATATARLVGLRHLLVAGEERVSVSSVEWTAGPGRGYTADQVAFMLVRDDGTADPWFALGEDDGTLDVPSKVRGLAQPDAHRPATGSRWRSVSMTVHTASGDCPGTVALPTLS